MKRVLFVDGSNLYGGLTELLKPGEYFDFTELLELINKEIAIDKVFFYGTFMRIDPNKSKLHRLIVIAQKAFFNSAKNNQKVIFYSGHFSGTGKEKGVDVHLAVDMAIGASTNQYDEMLIMTGDADLKYAVEKAQEFGKRISLVALSSRYPFGIASLVKMRIVYDVDDYFKLKIIPNYQGKPKNIKVIDLNKKINVIRLK